MFSHLMKSSMEMLKENEFNSHEQVSDSRSSLVPLNCVVSFLYPRTSPNRQTHFF